MDDREQQRKVRHRLAVIRHAEEVSGRVLTFDSGQLIRTVKLDPGKIYQPVP